MDIIMSASKHDVFSFDWWDGYLFFASRIQDDPEFSRFIYDMAIIAGESKHHICPLLVEMNL